MDPPILEAPSRSAVSESASAAFRTAEDPDGLDIATGIFNSVVFSILLLILLLVPLALYLLW